MTSIDDVAGVVLELRDGRKVKYSVLRVYKMVREAVRHEGAEHISLEFLTLPPTIEIPEKCSLCPYSTWTGPFLVCGHEELRGRDVWGLERPPLECPLRRER